MVRALVVVAFAVLLVGCDELEARFGQEPMTRVPPAVGPECARCARYEILPSVKEGVIPGVWRLDRWTGELCLFLRTDGPGIWRVGKSGGMEKADLLSGDGWECAK